jgi:hypothetical protein
LQYGSITFLSFHRIIRPSNRCDPLRTMVIIYIYMLLKYHYYLFKLYAIRWS